MKMKMCKTLFTEITGMFFYNHHLPVSRSTKNQQRIYTGKFF